MNIVAVSINEEGKVDITLEELNNMLEKAYNQGFNAGKGCTITTPSYPSYPQSPTTPITPISPIWYCGTCKDSSGTIGIDCNKVVGKIDPTLKVTGVSEPNSSFSEHNKR